MITQKPKKTQKKYSCSNCDFNSCNKKDYNRHLLTDKHKMVMIGNQIDNVLPQKASNLYICKCGNEYNHASGLSRHKKKCSINQEEINLNTNEIEPTKNFDVDKELLIKLLLKNQDVMEKMMEIMPQIGNNSSINTNSHNNNTFNIQMFLNDHCKNAMNLTDFIDTLPITAETYDNTIQNGLTKSMTNLLVNGLSQLDILKRPIHCTDASRKTLYVKDEDTWEKDTELQRLLLGITALAQKHRSNIDKWQEVNEGWETNENIQTKFTDLIFHTMDDVENNEKETGKIIRAISKNVYLDNEVKNQYI